MVKNEEIECTMVFATKNQPCVKDTCRLTMADFVDEDEDWEKDD